MKPQLINLALAILPLSATAQTFVEQEIENIHPVIYGELVWLDKNNDERSELVITGAAEAYDHSTQFFNNTGTNQLEEDVAIDLEGFSLSSSSTADFNNDGFADFIITGYNGEENQTNMYLNNGDGSFTEEITDVVGVTNGKIRTADFNHDNRVDLIVTGVDASSMYVAKLYFQNEDGAFVLQDQDLMANYFGDITIFDANNDTHPDLLLTGFDLTYAPSTAFYLNDGEGQFTEVEESGLPNIYFSGTAAADYDNDGDLDILMSGTADDYAPFTAIFNNNGEGIFTQNETADFTDLYFGTADFVDVNNDGNADVFITGSEEDGVAYSLLYIQTESGEFELDSEFSEMVIDVNISSVAWKDFDADGDMDVAITGFDFDGNRQFGFYVNQLYEPVYAGVNEQNKIQTKVYPNPSNGNFYVEVNDQWSNETQLTIQNMQGQIVYSISMNQPKVNINMSRFSEGTYILTCENDDIKTSKLITVQH